MDSKPSEETPQVVEELEKRVEEVKESPEEAREPRSEKEQEKQGEGEQKPASQTVPESRDAASEKQEAAPPPVELPQPAPIPQLHHKRRIIVKHSILGNKIPSHDPNVLVESSTFTSVGKIQPFLITISTNAALVMDYHCHLTTSEVVGYLAGTWDVNSHNLTVTQAYPCKCRLGDYESAPAVESEIRKTIKSKGLTLLGWYHSHPTAPATPSIRDIETQLDYELKMKGSNDSTYLPCVGIICSPYNADNPSFESNIVSYWVVPPPENKIHEYGKPMVMSYSVLQDQSISHDVLLEMKKCADFYKPEKDYIRFLEMVKGSVSFIHKLKMSVTPKFPLNHQKSEAFWTFVQDITLPSADKTDADILRQIVDISSAPAPPTAEKPKFNVPAAPPPPAPLSFKPAPGRTPPPPNPSHSPSPSPSPLHFHKSHSRSKSSSKRSASRDNKHLASLGNYFVGSDLAALFGSGKFPALALDPAAKSLLDLNSLSLGGMFVPPLAASSPSPSPYKADPAVGLMKPPPPPPASYYPYPPHPHPHPPRTSSNSRPASASRHHNRSIPSTSRDMPPPHKVPKLDVHQMANFFIPPNLGKNCTITNRPSTSTTNK